MLQHAAAGAFLPAARGPILFRQARHLAGIVWAAAMAVLLAVLAVLLAVLAVLLAVLAVLAVLLAVVLLAEVLAAYSSITPEALQIRSSKRRSSS